MAIRDKLRANAEPYLEPGEQVQAVFNAQTGPSPYWSVLTYLVLFWVKMHAVVVTDRRILVLKAGYWRPSAVSAVETTLPRETRLGPLSGLWATMMLAGQRYYVHKRFHKDAEAADAALGAGGVGAALPAPAGTGQPSAGVPATPAYAAPGGGAQPAPVAQAPPASDQAAPGWHPDPYRQARLRWWDGSDWTGHVSQ